MDEQDVLYDEHAITFLEALWGNGYLSPGGPDEVRRLLDGVSLQDKVVLDIGCGSGGITVSLAKAYGAAKVIGIDVEAPVCLHARETAVKANVADRVEIRQVVPGKPIPVDDGTIDIVFSKDSIVHIPDKEKLAQDAFRLLRPGGWFVASDWLISHDDTPSPEMAQYIAMEDLDFGMASPKRYQNALAQAGFTNIELKNRNRWYFETAVKELDRMLGPERPEFEATVGKEGLAREIQLWELMIVVLETGEHCPHHFKGQKPN
ncbi:MAG: methyltransferase domain-containing protein [Chloroflexota bacterium]